MSEFKCNGEGRITLGLLTFHPVLFKTTSVNRMENIEMFRKIFILFPIILASSLSVFAFDGSHYSQSGEELCLFLRNFYGGLNPYSMQCAMGAGAGEFTPHESGFCHKLVFEKRMNAGTCLEAISNENSDVKLDACELKSTEQEILHCLQL